MKLSVFYKQLFAYSDIAKKYFYTDFGPRLNIVYGKNTSGKSTLIESILYTFGINDEKHKLTEVLSEKVTFRLDIELINADKNSKEQITIVREDDVVIVRRMAEPIRKFIGIGGNRAVEHRELKEFWANLFEFDLLLESSGEYKKAPLEAFFLPFYVAQDVGWVYRHKSFQGLDFIKNFKTDFFDYYLGISNEYDREKKNFLELKKKKIETQIRFLIESQSSETDFAVSTLLDEKCVEHTNEYIQKYKSQKNELIKLEKDYLIESNGLTYLETRKNFLFRMKREIVNQTPLVSKCPTCNQIFSGTTENIYRHYQDLNDTEKQIEAIKKLLQEQKDTKGKINSIKVQIIELRNKISVNYDIYNRYRVDDLSLGSWISNKVNVKLAENVKQKVGQLTVELESVNTELKTFATEDTVNQQRASKSNLFAKYFKSSLTKLGVKPFDDDRYTSIYKIPAFPKQGVELLKTLLAYNISFCKIIRETVYVHDLPVLLDAIFKEDIEEENRIEIVKFLNDNISHQAIVSIADSKKNSISAADYNSRYLGGAAKMICIGSNERQRSFLSPYNGEYPNLLRETQEIIETDI